MQQEIPNTTLCCIDCINHDLSIRALQTSMASLSFERVLFLTDRPFDIPGIETVLIPALTSRAAYSAFVLHTLAGYIGTGHVLLIQWDGYVINPAAWREEFLQYDYIGAIWGTYDDSYRVGNGGFSLRSKKLLSACQSIPLDGEQGSEDELICRIHRPMLESDFGIRFAPEIVAARFAFELTYPDALPLGFHGLFNIWMVLAPADVRAYIESLPPNVVDSTQFLQLGINYRDLRQFSFAELVFRRIVAVDPAHAEAARQLAALAKRPLPNRAIGRNEPCPCGSGQRYKNCCGQDAGPRIARGMTRDEDIQWLLAVAMQHHQQGRIVHAAAIYRLILAEQPNHAFARQYLGVVAYQSGRFNEAVELIEPAVAARPEIPDFHNNLGLVFQAKGDLQRAAACFRHAMELNPNYVEAYNNLGLTLDADGCAAQAIPYFERAIALQPNFAQAHWNLSMSLLVTGDFRRGWQEYEWRLKAPGLVGNDRRFVQPAWQGEDLRGKTILLHAEQGFGDSIQFIRYVPMLAERGGKVLVECLPGLKRLFASVPGIDRLVERGEPLPAFDLQCALLSLPARFDTGQDSIPSVSPYLRVDPEWAATWRVRIPDTAGKVKIGLVWAGNPDHRNDHNRSIPQARLAVLAATEGVRFFSLQKGLPANRPLQAAWPGGLCDLTPQVEDFADMAALIGNLDLVVCVDTSIGHLAGALGKRVWVLLPFAPDWRWQLDRSDSPWYPSMRLYRQKTRGDWDEVLLRVRQDLQLLRSWQP